MNQKILVVDDEQSITDLLEYNLRQNGYRVVVARDGHEALRLARTEQPDLIVLDLMLPGPDGFDVCRELRRDSGPTSSSVPIIMLTARGEEVDRVVGLELGADDYVTKPFSIRVLLARVEAFLRRQRSEKTVLFRFGECEVDLVSHRLVRNGEEVPLTPKEYALLAYMVENAGRALAREQILDAAWGYDVFVTGRSVDRCVATLRSKIEPDSRKPIYIKTIRDVGYRFEPPEEDARQSRTVPGESESVDNH